MKTVKRILAIAVAVLLVAMMIPTAFAAGSNTVNWTCDKPGYTYTVYKVGTYNETTGAYTADYSALKSSIENGNTDTSAVAAACKDLTLTGAGAATFTTDAGSGNFTVDNGIYYIKLTGKSPNFKAITQESVVVFPNSYDNGANATTLDVNLSGKITEGEPTTSKWFKVGDAETQSPQSYGTTADTKTITYVLKATLPSSPVESLIITDKMGTGLKTDVHTIVSSELYNGTTKIKDVGATITTDSGKINIAKADTVNGKYGTTDNTFGVIINTADLVYPAAGSTDVYTVAVTFTTELDPATAQVNTEIPNSNDLIYGNEGAYNVVPGNEVVCKTYEIKAKKVDAATGEAIISGDTEFTLYKEDGTTVIATATTDRSGIADFGVKLPAGTYVVKETKAPAGYNLNSTPQTVTLDNSDTVTVTIEDTKAKLPSTGGNGTLMFTIIGGSLVLLAAALFIIVMKKRSSAK